MKAIYVEDLIKDYPGLRAVDGVSFDVERGEIFGMLGPNGAGKTTTIECLEGLREPSDGMLRVLGLDPATQRYELREQIGVQLQTTALYERMRVREALELFASFYRHGSPYADDWEALVGPLGLSDKMDSYYANLSGGQKQRLHIALAIIHDPDIVFLDELTTGLDPQARRAMWELIERIREQGTTVFLTTHYMEEAEVLCDRVAILDHGKILALDAPETLVAQVGGDTRVFITLTDPNALTGLEEIADVRRVEHLDGRAVLYSEPDSVTSVLRQLLRQADKNGWRLRDLHVERSSLEDVFLALTGREMRE
ncbi:MAG: ATP-binding cassette domain-containing protein [Candidatus Bipolaricaulia bacterium]